MANPETLHNTFNQEPDTPVKVERVASRHPLKGKLAIPAAMAVLAVAAACFPASGDERSGVPTSEKTPEDISAQLFDACLELTQAEDNLDVVSSDEYKESHAVTGLEMASKLSALNPENDDARFLEANGLLFIGDGMGARKGFASALDNNVLVGQQRELAEEFLETTEEFLREDGEIELYNDDIEARYRGVVGEFRQRIQDYLEGDLCPRLAEEIA